jgi:hypothetical protein
MLLVVAVGLNVLGDALRDDARGSLNALLGRPFGGWVRQVQAEIGC